MGHASKPLSPAAKYDDVFSANSYYPKMIHHSPYLISLKIFPRPKRKIENIDSKQFSYPKKSKNLYFALSYLVLLHLRIYTLSGVDIVMRWSLLFHSIIFTSFTPEIKE